MTSRTNYRSNPFNASTGRRKRKRKAAETKEWGKEEIDRRNESNLGVSWFNQNESDKGDSKPKKQKFAIDDYEVELSDDDDEGEEALNPEQWIMSINELKAAINESTVCRICHSPVTIKENPAHRAGLATGNLIFVCM